jgi:endo-1,4-beta-xylanase
MNIIDRRGFIKRTALAGAGAAAMSGTMFGFPTVLTGKKSIRSTDGGKLAFRPYYVQSGRGPHLLEWAYASDTNWDAFYSDITASEKEGVLISDTNGIEKFGVDVRWNVEGFGYIFITADNEGEYYTLPGKGTTVEFNLNYELARSRVARNRRRVALHGRDGWSPSRETRMYLDLSEGYLDDARKAVKEPMQCGMFSQHSLKYAMRASELVELEKARADILKTGYRPDFFIGCDARGFFQMSPELFMDRFTDVFNYATITHYLIHGVYQDFEPVEGKKVFDLRTVLFNKLREQDIVVEGRPLFWFYRTTTPDWLRKKSYSELLKYVESHTKEVMSHYGDGMYAWEIVNEKHDWANELELRPEQIVEVTKLACDVARATNPNVHRLINNCCPFAEYVQLRKWGELDAKYPQRTPHQFMRDLKDEGVDFTITGLQMYFPYRDLADTILLIDRYREFGRPVQLTEVGTTSGPTEESVKLGTVPIPTEPYIWHRHWDEDLQADWLEGLYTLAYSRPFIEAVNWYDFADPHSWIRNGGLLRTPRGEPKEAYRRLQVIQNEWKKLSDKV